MIVVADTSPIHVLVRIGHIEVLPALFDRVRIPNAVAVELETARYEIIRGFAASKPTWLETSEPISIVPIAGLHPGEIAAISLAQELKAGLLLVDDLPARKAAEHRGIAIIGALGVLALAASRGLLNLESAFDRVRGTDFRYTESMLQSLLQEQRKRESR